MAIAWYAVMLCGDCAAGSAERCATPGCARWLHGVGGVGLGSAIVPLSKREASDVLERSFERVTRSEVRARFDHRSARWEAI